MPTFVPSFPSSDLARTVEFYREVLGFDLIRVSGKGSEVRARVRQGEAEIIFRSREGRQGHTATLGGGSIEPVILHLEVEDVLGLYRRVQGRARVIDELETSLFGTRRFSVEDTEGMVLVFTQGLPRRS